jgi:hypothetical protein
MKALQFEEFSYTDAVNIVQEARKSGVPSYIIPERYNQDLELPLAFETSLCRESQVLVDNTKAHSRGWMRLGELDPSARYTLAVTALAVFIQYQSAY